MHQDETVSINSSPNSIIQRLMPKIQAIVLLLSPSQSSGGGGGGGGGGQGDILNGHLIFSFPNANLIQKKTNLCYATMMMTARNNNTPQAVHHGNNEACQSQDVGPPP